MKRPLILLIFVTSSLLQGQAVRAFSPDNFVEHQEGSIQPSERATPSSSEGTIQETTGEEGEIGEKEQAGTVPSDVEFVLVEEDASELWAEEEEEFGKEERLDFGGFVLFHGAGMRGDAKPKARSGDFSASDVRLAFDIRAASPTIAASTVVKGDLFHDVVAGQFGVDLREGYIDLRLGPLDLRAGRQILTWGVGDLLFISDVFPKDWVDYFTGKPMEFLKLGVDGLRAKLSWASVDAEIIAMPAFEGDRLPTGDRFSVVDPLGNIVERSEERPQSTYQNTEVAGRLHVQVSGWDISAYGYKGFWRAPALLLDNLMQPTSLTQIYPELNMLALSVQGGFAGNVFGAELGYYDSAQDRRGDNPLINNTEFRALLNTQLSFWPDSTLGLQYFAVLMDDYGAYEATLPSGFPKVSRLRSTITLRVEQQLLDQDLRISFFALYGINDEEGFLRPMISYNLSDKLEFSGGATLFIAARDASNAFVGALRNSDNLFVLLRHFF